MPQFLGAIGGDNFLRIDTLMIHIINNVAKHTINPTKRPQRIDKKTLKGKKCSPFVAKHSEIGHNFCNFARNRSISLYKGSLGD